MKLYILEFLDLMEQGFPLLFCQLFRIIETKFAQLLSISNRPCTSSINHRTKNRTSSRLINTNLPICLFVQFLIHYQYLYIQIMMIIKYSFGMGRRMDRLAKSLRKDFTQLQNTKKFYQMEQGENRRNDIDIRLSDAQDQAKKPVFKNVHYTVPKNQLLNKLLKSDYKAIINQQLPDYLDQAKMSIEDKTLKWTENRIMAEESKKFQKIYFKRSEIQRLIKKELQRPSNKISSRHLLDKGETLLAELNQKQSIFGSQINQMHKVRIDQFLQTSNSSLHQTLINSGILLQNETSKQKLIDTVQGFMNQAKSLQQNSQQLIWMQQDIRTVVDEIYQLSSNKQSLNIEILEQYLLDQQKLIVTGQTQFDEQVSQLAQVKDFQGYLFDKLYNQNFNLRYDGRLQFWMLTEDEQLNYIKNDLQYPNLILKTIQTFSKYEQQKLSVKIYPQLIQKLSTFKLPSFINYLQIIKQKTFSYALKQISINIDKLDDQTLVSTVYALSKMHPASQALIYKKIHKKFYPNLINEIMVRFSQLDTSQVALLVRNLSKFPFFNNQFLQIEIITKLIQHLQNIDKLSLFETESFLKILTQSSQNIILSTKDIIYDLLIRMQKLSQNDQVQISAFDHESLDIFCHAVLILKRTEPIKHLELASDIEQMQLDHLISTSSIQNLTTFLAMLSEIGSPRASNKMRVTKAKIMEILNFKQVMAYDTDLVNILTSLVRIDTQIIFKNVNLSDKLLLLGSFNIRAFKVKSPYYTPYNKFLQIFQEDLKNFSTKSKLAFIKSMALINHHKTQQIQLVIHSILEYDPLAPDLNHQIKLSAEEIGHIVQVMALLEIFQDYLFIRLMIHGLQKLPFSVNVGFETILQFMQAQHLVNLSMVDEHMIESFSNIINSSWHQNKDRISKTQLISALYYLLSFSFNKKLNKSLEYSLQLLTSKFDLLDNLILEEKCLINLINILGFDHFQTFIIQKIIDQKQIEALINVIEEQHDQQTGRFTKEQVVGQIQKYLLAQTGINYEQNIFLKINGLTYDRSDLSHEQKHLKVISRKQIINGQLKGPLEVIKMLTPNLKIIILEEFNQFSEQGTINEFLKSILEV